MRKSVLISIRPRWIEKIARGEKTIEVRKTRPNLNPPFKCYIYCTKGQTPVLVALQNLEDSPYVMTCGDASKKYPVEDTTWARLLNGTVCGEFTCDRIDRYLLYYRIGPGTVSTPSSRYALVEPGTFLPKKIDYSPMCLSHEEFAKYGNGGILFGWHILDLKIYDEPKELSELHHDCSQCGYVNARWDNCDFIIKHPPQSWCYVKCNVEGE